MIGWMGIVNLTPDSFFEPSRVWIEGVSVSRALERIQQLVAAGASIIDLGAVSTRPGAVIPSVEEEWGRLEPVLMELTKDSDSLQLCISIDTFRSEIVRRANAVIGDFIVNDISAGENDPEMLATAGKLGLEYVAMHKRGTPQTMDSLCDYPDGVVTELIHYFADFERRAASVGLDKWILDPGLGFAKTVEQNWEILEQLPQLKVFGRPILIGAANKRFTRDVPPRIAAWYDEYREGGFASGTAGEMTPGKVSGTDIANALAIAGGAAILRVHDIPE